jgi:hypothetical protein
MLQQTRSEHLPIHLQKTNVAIDSHIQEQCKLLEKRAEEVVDGEFFWKAARAAVPRAKAWKGEFDEYVKHPDRRLIDPVAVQNGLDSITDTAQDEVKALFSRELQDMSGPIQLTDEARAGLDRLRSNPDRSDDLVGQRKELKELFRTITLRRETAIVGAILTSSGVAMIKKPEMAEGIAEELIKSLARRYVPGYDLVGGDELLDHYSQQAREWIVEQIGEEAFTELVEAAGVAGGLALTGVGVPLAAPFAVWKTYRYGSLAKRLFIDKEPLQQIREEARDNGHQSLEYIGGVAKQRFEKRVSSWMEEMEAQLTAINRAATERGAWTLQRL